MNFFENQDRARRKSALLVLYFLAAVVLIVLAINLAAWILIQFGSKHPLHFMEWINSGPFWQVAFVSVVVIGAGSLVQFLQLRDGGESVAKMVRGTPIDSSTRNAEERRLMNIVEEMSIASGVVMPKLYVMNEEPGINAFVAGYQPNQAVLVVTRGALEQLNRDELQGVIGHEFSHLLNGDMRINVRLISILAGILLLGQVGEFLMRSTRYSTRSRDSDKALPVLLLGGLALMVIGYVGLFFGRLIKSAVSRQREFLADSSAVQFTRNPDGIAGALFRIMENQQGSLLSATRHAEDMNHMCFGETIQLHFQGLFASHPPLEERIRTIDPLFLTKMRAKRNQQVIDQRARGEKPSADANVGLGTGVQDTAGVAAMAGLAGVAIGQAQRAVQSIGRPQPEHYEYAQRLHGQWPEQLKEAVRQPAGANAIIAALLTLDMGLLDQEKATVHLASHAKAPFDYDIYQWALKAIPETPKGSRLPLLELCIASLRGLPEETREQVLQQAEDLIRIDQRYTLFEFVLITILRRQLSANPGKPPKPQFNHFDPVIDDLRRVLGVLARVGADSRDAMQLSFARAARGFSNVNLELPQQCSLLELSQSLNRLAALSPILKQPVLEACADCVLSDNEVRVAEYELIRAVAIVLDCPMPPLPDADFRL